MSWCRLQWRRKAGHWLGLSKHALASRFELLVSDHILRELSTTLNKPFFKNRNAPAAPAAIPVYVALATHVVTTAHVEQIATHPEDDLVLATAVSGRADYLVTGDLQLQRLGSYQGVTILSPASFVAILDAERESGAP